MKKIIARINHYDGSYQDYRSPVLLARDAQKLDAEKEPIEIVLYSTDMNLSFLYDLSSIYSRYRFAAQPNDNTLLDFACTTDSSMLS